MRALALLGFSLPALAQPTADCGTVQVTASALSQADVMAYCRYAAAERAKVEAFWGATWKEPIRIHVDRSFQISKALVPAYRGNRGLMEMPARHVPRKSGAVLHEIVHIYAPHANRFLAEGLAVYLQTKLGGNASLPNHGEALAPLARRNLPAPEVMAQLNAVPTPVPLGRVMDDMTAYILAGSFVEFLIERHGLPRFRALYDSGSYEAAYGVGFDVLEREWRASLQ